MEKLHDGLMFNGKIFMPSIGPSEAKIFFPKDIEEIVVEINEY
jgi:hypothetical protein